MANKGPRPRICQCGQPAVVARRLATGRQRRGYIEWLCAGCNAVEDELQARPPFAGCPWRQNDHCLHASCLPAKKKQFISRAVAQLNFAGMFSDDPKHFDPFKYEHLPLLLAAYQQRACPHLVIGWSDGGHAARPFGDDHYMSVYGDADQRAAWSADRPAGLRLGCTHGPAQVCFAGGGTVVVPERAISADQRRRQSFDGWRKRGEAQNKRTHKRIVEALSFVYSGIFPDTARAILAQLNGGFKGVGELDETALCRELANATWGKTSHKLSDRDPVALHHNACQLLQLAGQPVTALMESGSLAELAAEAERWLASYGSKLYYYEAGSTYSWHLESAAAALPAFDRLIDEFSSRRSEWAGNADIGRLYEELEQARAHAQTVCAQTSTTETGQ